tara:strand:+ start:468 stop:833 length:366 start_codon:yes stop_codon:yes gene_type:complete
VAQVLIVEDDDDVASLVRDVLARDGYDIRVGRDGGEGLDLAREHRPDLVLLDWMMPVKSGIEVCEELRSDEGFATTRIVMLTARRADEDRERAMAAGADDYLVKPFLPRALRSRVAELLAG